MPESTTPRITLSTLAPYLALAGMVVAATAIVVVKKGRKGSLL